MRKEVHDAKLSKALTKLLRHKALEHGVQIDHDGWVLVKDALRYINSREQNAAHFSSRAEEEEDCVQWVEYDVREMVAANDKRRFEVREVANGLQIRATTGHTMVLPGLKLRVRDAASNGATAVAAPAALETAGAPVAAAQTARRSFDLGAARDSAPCSTSSPGRRPMRRASTTNSLCDAISGERSISKNSTRSHSFDIGVLPSTTALLPIHKRLFANNRRMPSLKSVDVMSIMFDVPQDSSIPTLAPRSALLGGELDGNSPVTPRRMSSAPALANMARLCRMTGAVEGRKTDPERSSRCSQPPPPKSRWSSRISSNSSSSIESLVAAILPGDLWT